MAIVSNSEGLLIEQGRNILKIKKNYQVLKKTEHLNDIYPCTYSTWPMEISDQTDVINSYEE